MVWFLLLHIAALLVWAAALLYLPIMIGASPERPPDIDQKPKPYDSVGRFLFTQVATPAALVAIIAGTVVFLLNRTVDTWLIIKLSLVTALVMAHAVAGILVLREERLGKQRHIRILSLALLVVLCVLMTAIVWVVLAKPAMEWLP
ncbi:CopD family protein [Salinispirillum sp. LH 10-3-1]|uniref:Protoporphyrinogen IX oxidase n=1 Tax=Salinispirillum sp. LH 10-3-1 TaxID=2952525 RepID=A0AB38YI67_9GAMM